jgi:hypothetical protein
MFSVIFDLKTDADKYRFAIALPGYNEGDEQIYENINHCAKEMALLNLELNNYINHVYNIKDKEKSFFVPAKLRDELMKIMKSAYIDL